VSGGTLTATTIGSGGTQYALGGTVTSTTLGSGGFQGVRGATLISTTISGGTQWVSAGTVTDTTVTSGEQRVFGGTVTLTTVGGGGLQRVVGGAVSATTVNSGGSQFVQSHGRVSATTINAGGLQYLYSGGTASDTTVNSGGLMNIESGAAISGTTTLIGGTAALIGSGSYTIANLTATGGGTVNLACGTTVGRSLTINSLSGSANFVINTDLAHGQADQINITSSTQSQNTLQVNFDPGFATGNTATGSATFATVSGGSAGFTAVASEYGAYRYTPTIVSTTSGTVTSWMITQPATASGVSETVHTASDVIAGNLIAWRTENNNLTKRMGELQAASGEAGIWLRTYRGAEEISGGEGRTTKQQYTALQGGYDNKISRDDGTLYAGYALGYLQGSDTYNRGSGNASSFSAGAYGSWLGNKGHFLDVIAKTGKLRNSYISYLNDADSTKVNGSYANWGTSLSTEYGYRSQLKNNWYLEPQAELTYSRINGASYIASDGTSVKNDAANSLVGRLGLSVGRNEGVTHYYGKASLAREFAASATVTASNGILSPASFEQNMKESWLEFALGLTTKLDKRVDGYLEITRTTGDKTRTPWQVNTGARWNF